MFLDSPSMGTAFRHLVKLMQTTRKAERTLLWPFCEEMALACGSYDPTAIDPISVINSKWKRIAYTKGVTSLATTVWEGHRAAARKAPPKPPTYFDLLFGGLVREEDGDQGWGDS